MNLVASIPWIAGFVIIAMQVNLWVAWGVSFMVAAQSFKDFIDRMQEREEHEPTK
jgi:hypothetical protein